MIGNEYKMSNKTPFKYDINEIVNNSLKIKKQTNNKRYEKIYEVQSIAYPEAPTYFITEYSLVNGTGCAYVSHRRICEQNSLFSIESVKPYLVNVEEAKTIAPKSNKKIKMKCPDCKREKYFSGKRFLNEGFSCPMCDRNISYPELFFISYSEVKGLKFEYQKSMNDLPNKVFDFYSEDIGVVETHGIFHYEKGVGSLSDAHEKSKESDRIKREYCNRKNISLIELDCRESNFNYIKNSINNCKLLPNISKDEESDILKTIAENKKYPIKDIVKLYKKGLSSVNIAKKYSLSSSTIRRILVKSDVIIREGIYTKKRIRCITTGEVFSSMEDAYLWCNLQSSGSIRANLQGKQKTAGKHPKTGEPLKWESVNK